MKMTYSKQFNFIKNIIYMTNKMRPDNFLSKIIMFNHLGSLRFSLQGSPKLHLFDQKYCTNYEILLQFIVAIFYVNIF